MLPRNPPDFVLMDINLPGMSGIECTRELKRLLPDVDVLILTMFGNGIAYSTHCGLERPAICSNACDRPVSRRPWKS